MPTAMCLGLGEEIGDEVHQNLDQFFRNVIKRLRPRTDCPVPAPKCAMSRMSALSLILALLFTTVLGAQFAPRPPEQAARVISRTGQVSVMKDSVPSALMIGDTIQVRQLIITGSDGFAICRVTDGSTFEVYPNSHLTFRNNSGNWKDILNLWLGRVRVHIQRFGGQPNPNRVRTPTAVISVRG